MFDLIIPPPIAMLDSSKRSPSALYSYQPYTVQIIQLVEGPPPPRRAVIKLNPSSYASSSSQSSEEYSEDEEEESICSSYCSSVDPVPPTGQPVIALSEPSPETYALRMKRILAWRENFSSQLSATLVEPSLSSTLKRKLQCDDKDRESDVMSRSSKRSRSSQGGSSASSLGDHSCPACDACFDSRQDLRLHGRQAGANEACFVAVEYAFE